MCLACGRLLLLRALLLSACTSLGVSQLSALTRGAQKERCNENFADMGAFSLVSCKECGVGKYGTGGVCYTCPSFTRQLKHKDVQRTLWCENSCEKLYDNNDRDIVDFRHLKTQKLQDMVLHSSYWSRGHVVCKACAQGKFSMTRSANIMLEHYVPDLLGMAFTQEEIEILKAHAKKGAALKPFEWTICSSCPPGFVSGTLSIPESVQEMSGVSVSSAGVSASSIPCAACAVSLGVPSQSGKCEKCPSGSYQHAQNVSVWLTQTLMVYLVVGVKCNVCPAGTQMLKVVDEGAAFWSQSQCRSIDGSCCSRCPSNFYKTDSQTRCKRVDAPKVAIVDNKLVEFGGTSQRQCGSGEQMVHCHDGECQHTRVSSEAWKTCLPCSWDATTRSTGGSCIPCDHKQKQHYVNPDNPETCAACNLCTEVHVTSTRTPLTDLPQFSLLTTQFAFSKKTVDCIPLQQRRLTKTAVLGLELVDHWRDELKATGEALPPLHYVDRTAGCVKKTCAAHCNLTRFKYSDGCGRVPPDERVWVQDAQGTNYWFPSLAISDVSDVTKWKVLTEGKCTFCKTCARGWYNDGCNRDYELDRPEGRCTRCQTICDKGFFLRHPVSDAGCHDPPEVDRASGASDGWKIDANYKCERCPTWVKLGTTLKAVTACGLSDAYWHFSSETVNDVVQRQLKTVTPLPDGDTPFPGAGDTPRKNFRSFMSDLQAYCPTRFFFNAKQPGCNFVNTGERFTLPGGLATVTVGYQDYKPECCQLCTTCSPPLEFKDSGSWKECKGDSVEDTQDRCMPKCVLGYWKDTNGSAAERTCKRCSTCYEGIL